MSETKRAAIRDLAKWTGRICGTCPVSESEKERHEEFHCCDKMFCDLVREALPANTQYDYDDKAPVPYLKNNKCVVSPEHRPWCAAFLCPGWRKKNPVVWKQYEKRCRKAGVPPTRK